MRDTEKDKLFADGTLVPFSGEHKFAFPGVSEYLLHLDTAGLLAVRVPALGGMYQSTDALLNRGLAGFLWVQLLRFVRLWVVNIKS